jgi:hypothetical protein
MLSLLIFGIVGERMSQWQLFLTSMRNTKPKQFLPREAARALALCIFAISLNANIEALK